MRINNPCPCGSTLPLSACCNRWHAGEPAPTAEDLMRSRYTAFVVHNANYLLATWHASTRPSSLSFEPNQKWLGLTVVQAKVIDAASAEVEFIARYRIGGGSAARLHECSQFIKEGDRWLYVDGEQVG